jgi:hypothetical protein
VLRLFLPQRAQASPPEPTPEPAAIQAVTKV